MRTTGRIFLSALFLGSFLLAAPTAHAYIDAFTGSFLFQLLAGGLITVAVGFKLFGKGIWGLLSRRGRSDATAGIENSSTDD